METNKTIQNSMGHSYPLLEKINSPADLRKLPVNRLPEVCAQIRAFLIDTLCNNPGHFASSMGAVEITVALHYVFNTPYDRIVWDVGHQAYGHKILTGRRDLFSTIRHLGGLSGFPNPEESPYDTFTAGHASNSISAALGMSVATQLQGDIPQRNVVAVIGDAAISGGLAFEALNNAANANANLLIILNDNDMSIDRPTGSLNSYLAHMTTSKAYNTLRYKAYMMLKKMHLVSESRRGSILRFANSLKSLIVHEQNLFEGLNLRYFGPFDGHDIQRIVRVLTDIKDMKGPRLLHLRTIKGKGYAPAELHPAEWHAPGKFNPVTGERLKDNNGPKPPKFQDVFGETLVELAKKNDKIVGVTAAMLSGTSMSKLAEAFPERTFDVGISEGHAVTFAGGMAKDGLRPFVAIYSSFLQRAYDNIINDVAILHLPVTFCIDRAGIVGEDGTTHHGSFDMSYLRPVPGLTIAAPRDEHILRHLMFTAQSKIAKGPWVMRYPRGAGNIIDWKCPMHTLTPGKGERLTDGSDAVLLAIGPVVYEALKAAKKLMSADGISVAVYDMIFLKPLDNGIIDEAVSKNIPLFTVEDGCVIGGLGSAVAEILAGKGANCRLTRLGLPTDKFVAHGTVSQLRALCKFDADSIAEAIISQMRHKQ